MEMMIEMIFAPINYFIASIVYIVLSILSFKSYIRYKNTHKIWRWYLLGLSVEAFLIVLHTLYWCIAKTIHGCGNLELYDKLSAPIPFALAQGFETLGGIIMLCVFILILDKKQSGQ